MMLVHYMFVLCIGLTSYEGFKFITTKGSVNTKVI